MSKRWTITFFVQAVALGVLGVVPALAQFQSGSTGADGALNLVTPGTVVFDPAAMNLNSAGDNIFNFTTINIGAGVTVKLRASKLRQKPVVWLATGAVTIAGTLDLNGDDGYADNSPGSLRSPSDPGPGGYAGGVGATDSSPSTGGAGPGGAAVASYFESCGSYATVGQCGTGTIYGNSLLVPLRGGSGGAGSLNKGGGGGGAGGGAIQIVSSVSIAVTGTISSNGGIGFPNTFGGGSGSGGGIHLEAPGLSGNGAIQAYGGVYSPTLSKLGQGGDGRIRIDTNTNTFSGTFQPAASFGPLFNSPLPSAVPIVTVLTINGVAVPSTPTGSFSAPDVTINSGTSVPVTLAAENIPLGTVLKLTVSSETGTDQIVSSTPLTGTVANSTASASIAWPLGVSKVFVRASW